MPAHRRNLGSQLVDDCLAILLQAMHGVAEVAGLAALLLTGGRHYGIRQCLIISTATCVIVQHAQHLFHVNLHLVPKGVVAAGVERVCHRHWRRESLIRWIKTGGVNTASRTEFRCAGSGWWRAVDTAGVEKGRVWYADLVLCNDSLVR